MILSGDEFANTQYGNNNAYCQDNEISWLDWSGLEKNREHYDYVRNLTAFRTAHPVLRNMRYEFGHNGTGYPELSFHGTEPWQLDENAETLVFAYMYAEDHVKFKTRKDCFIYIAVNAHWEPHTLNLPIIPDGFFWHLAFDSNGFSSECGKEKRLNGFASVDVEARTVKVLLAKQRSKKR
jgi:glycogen operon protein